jgi:glycosyltransferase involved in cell wall biosynthesis
MSDLLPVSVIIPTRNCRSELVEHLKMMQPVFEKAAQVIGVDGSSEDGTAEVLSEFIESRPNAKFLSLPPGLYEGWNAAVAEADQPWVYFSTIGDFISLEGLSKLLGSADSLKLDLVISPPKMVQEDGTDSPLKWPIHHFTSSSKTKEIHVLSLEQKILGFCSFFTGSILGSSASNIYKTDFLKQHPFPTDFGHAGDTIWAVRNLTDMRAAIIPENFATFRLGWKFKEADARIQRDTFEKMCDEAKITLEKISKAEYDFLQGWFSALCDSKLVLWNWLASQAELAKSHHELIAVNQKMAIDLEKRLPERIFQVIQRRLMKK